MKRGSLALLCSIVLMVPVMAASGSDSQGVSSETVGGFAVKLAAALGTPAGSEQVAAASLRSAGVSLQADLSARLTEAEAARILSDLGVKVAPPSSPADEVSNGKSAQLAAAAGLSLSASPGIDTTSDDLPVHCLLEKNQGQCVGCCKPELGFVEGDPQAGQITKFCVQFCKTSEPPCPSPPCDPEPQP
jgi:hypothetical protein